jgi:hypothetical protein
MRKVLFRSTLFALFSVAISQLFRIRFHTDQYLGDVSGLSAFLSVFGTLYGILTAFVVFEVWTQYNRISELIDKEAQGLERLYRLVLYFRDDMLTAKIKAAISEYANLVIQANFKTLAQGGRNQQNSAAFRKMADIIREIKFDDDHDTIVYGQVLEHYLSVVIIGFLQAMIFQMVEDLDNPFVGEWSLTPEPFVRALKHIDEDY